MVLNENPTYYDVLDLRPEASPQEIREAYFRIKSTYNKDSVALYSLISASEREEVLRLIEEAYEVLSSQEKRREYDRYNGLMDSRTEMTSHNRPAKKIVSIDRVPPMDMAEGDDLLVPPTTDFPTGAEPPGKSGRMTDAPMESSPFEDNGNWPAAQPQSPVGVPAASAPLIQQQRQPQTPAAFTPTPTAYVASSTPPNFSAPSTNPPSTNPPSTNPPNASPASGAAQPPPHNPSFAFTPERAPVQAAPVDAFAALAREIEQETEWKGLLLRRIREAKRISLEEMAANTKISKTYILALEEDNYVKLPAAVYIRGFVTQLARVLKLPYNQVATAYMARYYQSHPNKN